MKQLKYIVQTGTLQSLIDQTIIALNQITGITACANTLNINTIISINYPVNYTDLQILNLGITMATVLYPNYNLPKI